MTQLFKNYHDPGLHGQQCCLPHLPLSQQGAWRSFSLVFSFFFSHKIWFRRQRQPGILLITVASFLPSLVSYLPPKDISQCSSLQAPTSGSSSQPSDVSPRSVSPTWRSSSSSSAPWSPSSIDLAVPLMLRWGNKDIYLWNSKSSRKCLSI